MNRGLLQIWVLRVDMTKKFADLVTYNIKSASVLRLADCAG